MLLKRIYVDIDSVVFDCQSYVDGHSLHINKDELISIINDRVFTSLDIIIAIPGTNCRILNICDVVQPTLKLDDEDTTFPGLVGRIHIAGRGRSLMLRNIVVSEVAEVAINSPALLDMSASGAQCTVLAQLFHVVIDATPAEEFTREEYFTALHRASKKLAKHLAMIARNCTPDETEDFTLEQEGLDGLPRIAYIAGVFCHEPMSVITLYGENMLESLPVIIHPNEIIDGAFTNMNYVFNTMGDPTYIWQNHPVILDLYRRHGIDLNFVGVVVMNIHHRVDSKRRNAIMSAAMVHYQLKADGCILTKEGGGHPQVDIGIATESLEGEYGIKTTLILYPLGGAGEQLIFNTPYANAIVSIGRSASPVRLPKADQVVGSILVTPTEDGTVSGPLTVEPGLMPGGFSQVGWTKYGTLTY